MYKLKVMSILVLKLVNAGEDTGMQLRHLQSTDYHPPRK
jgi:hypothetical protein